MVRQQNLSSTVETAAAAGVEPNAARAPRLAASLRTSLMRRFTLTVALACVCALMIGTVLLLNTSHEATERKTAYAQQHVTQNLDRIEKRWRAEALVYAGQLTLARVLVNADPTLLRARFTAFATSLGGSATFTQALLYDAQGRLLASYRTRSGAAADQVQPANIAAAWWFDRPDQTLYRIVRVPLLVNGERAQLHLYAPFDAALLETLSVPGIDLYPKWQTQSLPNLSAMPQDSMEPRELLPTIFNSPSKGHATLVWPGEARGLELELRTQPIWLQPWQSRLTFIGIAFALILALGWIILGRWIVREVVVPVDAIARVAQLVARGGVGERAVVSGPPELQTVALEFNRMLDARVTSELALRQSEAVARESRTILKDALDSLPDAFALFDCNDRLVECNQKYAEAFTSLHSIDEIAGWHFRDLVRASVKRGEVIEPEFAHDVEAWVDERERRHRNAAGNNVLIQLGDARWIRVQERPTRNGGIVGVRTDITEQLRLERELRESQKMAAIGTLAGGIAHDFNNIITAILGNAKIVAEDAESDPRSVRISIDEIRRAAVRGRSLVQQIMAYSGRYSTQRKPTALNFVIDRSVRKLSATLPPQIVIEVRSPPDIPQVLGDEAQIQQVIMNLVTNSMQALSGRSGRIEICLDQVMLAEECAARPQFAAWYKPQPQQCEVVRLMIRDDGAGMDAATLEKIFDPFFTTRPMGEGKGMGLSVVQGVVATHEGTIIVESQVGKGTTFIIYLPAVAEHANASVEPDAAASQ